MVLFRSAVSQSIKEVMQSLVDDGLVQTDKVGSSNYGIPEDRTASLAKRVQHKELQALETELQANGACDPVKVEEKKRAVILAKEAAARWTDNYLILLSHFTRQNGVEADDVRKYLGVGEDYEDIC
ncbi:hypothetical protein EVG20_g9374 [Dentipellis fragilis]|uniref:Meiotic nuclear division protein 1 n=1 Tax=Dentipellis fragilis TaxID=205917 RepID=A0A4Y9XYW6_9AGAM|nr:hypothetical protein EVG20_g9374 [Dentipellis fragilis]